MSENAGSGAANRHAEWLIVAGLVGVLLFGLWLGVQFT